MAKKTRGRKKSRFTSTKTLLSEKKNWIIIIASLIVIIAIGGFISYEIFSPPVIRSEYSRGYAVFFLYDRANDDFVDGEITLVLASSLDTEWETIETGETIRLTEDVYAYVSSVDLESGDTREFLPTTIVPRGNNDPNAPQSNSINLEFIFTDYDQEITVLDGDEGSFDASDLDTVGKRYEMTIEFTVAEIPQGGFGNPCWVPEHGLPALNVDNNVHGYGLYLVLDTEIDTDTVLLNGLSAQAQYLEDLDISIILLRGIYRTDTEMELEFRIFGAVTELYTTQGFLPDFDANRKDF